VVGSGSTSVHAAQSPSRAKIVIDRHAFKEGARCADSTGLQGCPDPENEDLRS
jgi:hypothetical protein